jgi:acetyl-CoA acetyltransferase
MTDAVIVSTARTGLAKSWKGAFNMTYGATLAAHSITHAVKRAGVDPAEVEDVILGGSLTEGTTGGNIARVACPSPPRASASTASARRGCRRSRWPRNASSSTRCR